VPSHFVRAVAPTATVAAAGKPEMAQGHRATKLMIRIRHVTSCETTTSRVVSCHVLSVVDADEDVGGTHDDGPLDASYD
jgi:hypothetical protein